MYSSLLSRKAQCSNIFFSTLRAISVRNTSLVYQTSQGMKSFGSQNHDFNFSSTPTPIVYYEESNVNIDPGPGPYAVRNLMIFIKSN
jgi:hypothetical protein